MSVASSLFPLFLCYIFGLAGGTLFEIPNGLILPSLSKNRQYAFRPWFQTIKVPSFLGIVLAGVILANMPGHLLSSLDYDVANSIRLIALISIIYRIALGLDTNGLKGRFGSILRLGLFPNIVESIFCAFLSMFFFHLEPMFAFPLGFIAAGASTAVLVPILVTLQEGKYGIDKGIPTTLLASSAVDNILSIMMYNLVSTISLSEMSILFEGPSLLILKSILGLLLGGLIGVLYGNLLSYLGNIDSKALFVISYFSSFGLVFSLNFYGFRGAGFLSVVLFVVIASNSWPAKKKKKVSKMARKCWDVLRYFLFVLIGVSIQLDQLTLPIVLLSLIIVVVCTLVRMVCCFLSFPESDRLTNQEKFYAAFTWISKASLQAALGSAIYYEAKIHNLREDVVKQGVIISYICVVYIVVTAPIGALLMAWFGPKWLKKHQVVLKGIGEIEKQEEELELSRRE